MDQDLLVDKAFSHHEARVSSLKTVVKLLDHLPLQPDEGYPGDDVAHVLSRRYMRYQSSLLQILPSVADDGVSTMPTEISSRANKVHIVGG